MPKAKAAGAAADPGASPRQVSEKSDGSAGSGGVKSAVKAGNIVGVCPDCGGSLWHIEGCMVCKACGYSKCG